MYGLRSGFRVATESCEMTRVQILLASAAVLSALCGCQRVAHVMQKGERVLCTLDGTAYMGRNGPGDTSFLTRMPEADQLCKRSFA